MKLRITLFRKSGFFSFALLWVGLLFCQTFQAQSVPIYANVISSQNNTDFSANSVDGNLATRARVRANSGIAVGVGAYSGHLELQFPSVLPANTTSYVKLQTDDNLLPALLAGSLGSLVSDVLGGVLIGNQEFTIQAKNGNDVVLQGNSQTINDFSSARLRVVVNANNDYFIAVTPNQAYNRLRLTNRVGSLVGLGNTKRLDVFEAFYIGTPDVCGGASYTSFDGTGLNLDLLNLGGAGVTNPNRVLDGNPNNFSQLSLGILAVAASIEQTVYFDGLSQNTDQFLIRMRVDPSLVALGVVNNIQIIASNGPNVVQIANLNSLLNLDLLTLLQGNQVATIRFSPGVPVNRITVRYNSLLNVQLTQSLDLYTVQRAPANPTITDAFTLEATICSGSSAALIAQTVAGTQLNWYAQPQGGTILATTNSGEAFTTPNLTDDTSYYVSAKRIGCPEESQRIRVDVGVVDLPVASDIEIADSLNACNGAIVLSPSANIGGAVFKYYKDQAKTQEITTGFSGDAGVTYVKNTTTGELSISGLTQANSPYQYYISLLVDGICENAASTLKQVTVNYSSSLALNVSPTLIGCGSVNLRNAILNFDTSPDTQYNFFDASNNPITPAQAANVVSNGNFFIQATSLSGNCSSTIEEVLVIVNPNPTLTVQDTSLVVNVGDSVTLNATSNVPIAWYDSNGNALPSNTTEPFTTPGFYTFTVVANNDSCIVSRNVSVTVIDPSECPPLSERDYANIQSWSSILTGGVSNANQAIDGNPRTFSTITTGIGLLGIGTTWQNLQWTETIPAGKPVTVKLGSEYSGVIVAGAYSIVGTKRNGSGVPIDIGTIQPISGSLVDLLAGENAFEFTFVPSNATGPKAYDGIRIIVGSLVSVAQNVKVYEAYYEKSTAQTSCNGNDVEDVFFGAVDLGVGVASATVGVSNPYDSVDGNETTFATMFSGAGILAAADLTVAFKTPTATGDSTELILSRPATILDLNLLTGFTIQLYLGNTPVGAPITNNSTLLSLTLLSGGSEASLVIAPQTQSYDRLKIRFGGVASVLDVLRVHEIRRFADTSVVGGDASNTIQACQGETVALSITPDDCTTYVWYDAAIVGNVVSTGTSFEIPNNLAAGTYAYFIQAIRFGCAVYERGEVTVVIGETAPPTAITSVTINGTATTNICSATGNVTLTATLAAIAITNPVFYWYSLNGSQQQLIPGQTTSTLVLNNLAAGNYTYFVGISSDEYCPTAVSDRTQVNFSILPSSEASDISGNDVLTCVGTDAVITPSSTLTNPVFSYYFSNNNSQPITNGTVGGITYTISPAGTLTISGLTVANSPYTYYVGLTSDTTCLNAANDFQAVVVTVTSSGTPTTTDETQDFCLSETPTVGNIAVNQANVEFYDAPAGGNLVPDATTLVDGATYYAAFDASSGCVGGTRLAITVTINDAATPTTSNTTQGFCIFNEPRISNIQVNEPNVQFYSAANGGNPLNPTNLLVNGATYFASLTDSVNGCGSSVRLAITVTLNDVGTPSTNDGSQQFCLSENPTVADLQVNEANVVFYTSATSEAPLAATTALVTGNYFTSLFDGSGCESSVRLVIAVSVSNPGTPTTANANQNFCLSDNPRVSNLQANETDVVFYASETGGAPLSSATALTNGTYYVAQTVGGCESTNRLAIVVTISNPATPTTSDTTQEFCAASNPTLANIQVNETNIVFYANETGGTPLPTTQALVDGATYYVAQTDGNGCESTNRLAISVTTTTSGTPTANNASQEFCQSDNPTIADVQVNETNVVFYDQATGGNVLPATTPLTNTILYAAFSASSGCESTTRLEITVTVGNPSTPTTNDATQVFCLSDNATVANLQVNETDVLFYASETGGTPLSSATALTNGSYYVAQILGSCESTNRLAIVVTISNPTTPTTADTTQEFCTDSNPTLASIQVNETNIVFYANATGGTPLPTSQALVDGATYFVAQTDGNGCESGTRLAIAVSINTTGGTPTTTDATQDFCLVDAPTIAAINVNETNVVFYANASGGSPLPSTTTLTNGTTYFASFDGTTGCASNTRLAITVTINDVAPPTTNDTTQDFCQSANPTVINIQTNQPNVIFYTVATGGTALGSATPLTAGVYYAVLLDAITGCQSSVRLAITVSISNGEIPVITGGDTNVCVVQEVTYTTNVGKTNYVWTVVNGTIIDGGATGDNFATVSWTDNGPGSINVTYADSCSPTNTAVFNVVVGACSDITISKTVNNATPNIGDNVVFTITVSNVGNGSFENVIITDALPSGYAFVSESASAGSYSSVTGIWTIPTLTANQTATLNIMVRVLPSGNYVNTATITTSNPEDSDPGNNVSEASVDPVCLTVYNEFTPNGDGDNETFRIDCLENYPGNKLEVYNRYGVLVYSKNNYANDWDGTSNASGTLQQDNKLPTGTYYYVLNLGATQITKNGWLYLVR